LIELLVVIAIIGILAAMVFPVFARARESARKAVCLSNVKNIALAIQMYLSDNNDTLPPNEHRAEVLDYFDPMPFGGNPAGTWFGTTNDSHCLVSRRANPYLRWPVILDEYTKNRDVYRCPSAKLQIGAGFIIPVPNWFQFIQANEGNWDQAFDIRACMNAFPVGWGGAITDSITQQSYGVDQAGTQAANKAFVQTIGSDEKWMAAKKMPEIENAASTIIVNEIGSVYDGAWVTTKAYPDLCALECSGFVGGPNWIDWSICASAASCGLYSYAPNNGSFVDSPDLRRPYARHLGGVNLGFLDGHATWISSERLIQAAADGDIRGTGKSFCTWTLDCVDPASKLFPSSPGEW